MKVLNVEQSESSDDDIELKKEILDDKPTLIIKDKPKIIKLNKSGKEKKPYVLTAAREEQFKKAREIRDANVLIRKGVKDEKSKEYIELKAKLEIKKDKILKKKQDKEIKTLLENDITTDEEEVVEIVEIIKKPKARKTIKKVYYEEEEDEIIIKKKPVSEDFKVHLGPKIRYF